MFCMLQGNFVRKTGDTMTGDLYLGMNRLFLTNGYYGGAIRGCLGEANRVEFRNMDDSGYGLFNSDGGYMSGNLSLDTGKTVDNVDISQIKQAKIIQGSYTGNDADNRTIDIGVNLTAKANVWVIVCARGSISKVHKPAGLTGDSTIDFVNASGVANQIQALKTTGFQVGTDVTVNASGNTYDYIVIYQEP